MTSIRRAPRWLALAATALLSLSPKAHAVNDDGNPADFLVGDIRVEGLQRIAEGTVFNYLPVNIGDHLTSQRVREAIRALWINVSIASNVSLGTALTYGQPIASTTAQLSVTDATTSQQLFSQSCTTLSYPDVYSLFMVGGSASPTGILRQDR